MHARTLDVLHDARNDNILSVAYGVDLRLRAHEVLIDEDRMLLCVAVDDRHELLDFLIIQGDLHALASENIGRAHEYRISDFLRGGHGGFKRGNLVGLPDIILVAEKEKITLRLTDKGEKIALRAETERLYQPLAGVT